MVKFRFDGKMLRNACSLDISDGERTQLMQPLLDWPRGHRESFQLTSDRGVYALFLLGGCKIEGFVPGKSRLLYVGSANGRRGLKGRCHFNASTANHSPRKSLAVLLMKQLRLKPVLVIKPKGDTWGLDERSEKGLTEWMLSNLHLAVAACNNPLEIEDALLIRFAPPLNLTVCKQTPQHHRISEARAAVLNGLRASRKR